MTLNAAVPVAAQQDKMQLFEPQMVSMEKAEHKLLVVPEDIP